MNIVVTAQRLRRFGLAASLNGKFLLPLRILRRIFSKTRGTATIHDFDGSLTIDLKLSEHMQRRIFWTRYYSREIVALLDRRLKPGMTFVDIGANIGEITLVASKRVTATGHVIAFEPMPEIHSQLLFNVQRNKISNVTASSLALGDKHGLFPIYRSSGQSDQSDDNEGLGSLYPGDPNQPPATWVQVCTLDSYLNEHPVKSVDFIKIDVEGSEHICIKGALETIRKYRPEIIVEIQSFSSRAAGRENAAVIDLLSPLGYEFFRIGSAGSLKQVHRKDLADFQNVLCLPTSA